MRKNFRLNLDQVSLVLVSGVDFRNSMYALWRSSLWIKFHEIVFVTDHDLKSNIGGICIVKTNGFALNSIEAYSEFCVYKLHGVVNGKFALIVQADGYVINPHSWTSEFLNYDYIGAPWPLTDSAYIDPFGNHQRVGNGGFSLRSKKLLQTPLTNAITWNVNEGNYYKHMNVGSQAEDGIICVHNRHIYEEAGNIFAPIEVASKFSYENKIEEDQSLPTFGFHAHFPKTQDKLIDILYRFIFRIRYPFL